MRPAPEHHVEQEDADGAIARRLAHARGARLGVQHRVRAAHGELVGAEIQDAMAAGAAGADVAADRAERGLQQQVRFVGQRAAGVEAEQRSARRAQRHGPRAHAARIAEGPRRPRGSAQLGHDGARGVLQRADPRARRARARRAEAADDDGLAGRADGRLQRGPRGGRGRLGDDDDGLGPRIPREHGQGQRGHRAPDLGREIAAAHADAVRDTFTQRGQPRDDGLQPGAGGRHAADAPARNDVGEPETDAGEIGGAAVGPHAQQAPRGGQALELHLLRQRHVIAEEEHVQAVAQRGPRLQRGVGPRHRDHREVGVGARAARGLQRARAAQPARGLAPLLEHRARRRQRGGGGGVALGLHGDDEIARSRVVDLRRRQPGGGQQRAIGRGAHERGGLAHARLAAQARGDAHQHDRVLVEGAPDGGANGHAAVSPRTARRTRARPRRTARSGAWPRRPRSCAARRGGRWPW